MVKEILLEAKPSSLLNKASRMKSQLMLGELNTSKARKDRFVQR